MYAAAAPRVHDPTTEIMPDEIKLPSFILAAAGRVPRRGSAGWKLFQLLRCCCWFYRPAAAAARGPASAGTYGGGSSWRVPRAGRGVFRTVCSVWQNTVCSASHKESSMSTGWCSMLGAEARAMRLLHCPNAGRYDGERCRAARAAIEPCCRSTSQSVLTRILTPIVCVLRSGIRHKSCTIPACPHVFSVAFGLSASRSFNPHMP
jgi:hypothetical protein